MGWTLGGRVQPRSIMADIIRVLNDLIATCRDSEEGFGKAAKGAHSDRLRDRLIAIARERADFSDELREEVRRLGGEPAESGHQSGIQERGWRELEASIRPPRTLPFSPAIIYSTVSRSPA